MATKLYQMLSNRVEINYPRCISELDFKYIISDARFKIINPQKPPPNNAFQHILI